MVAVPQVLLVGERDLLASVASPAGGPATLARPAGADPLQTAARARALGPELVVVLRPQARELEALREAGSNAVGWPHDWFPVADELYGEGEPARGPARVFFSGAASEARDRFLQPVKHRFDVLHLAGGANLAELTDLMGRCGAAIDLAPEPGLAEVDRIGPAMASGMLVLAQAPVSRTGLGDWREIVAFANPGELDLLIADLLREPGSFEEVRRRGRQAAEAWRASVALPRFVSGVAG